MIDRGEACLAHTTMPNPPADNAPASRPVGQIGFTARHMETGPRQKSENSACGTAKPSVIHTT